MVINRVDSNGDKQDTWETVKGVLSGTNLTNCVRGVEGTASAWSAGTVVEILMTAEHWNKMVEWAETEHNQDGTHDDTKVAMLAGTQEFTGDKTFSGAVKVDTISEKTTDAGVTVDGCLIKDGKAADSDKVDGKDANKFVQDVNGDTGRLVYSTTFTKTISGTSGTFTISNPFTARPSAALITCSGGGNMNQIVAGYNFDNSDATNLQFWWRTMDGSSLSSGDRRFSVIAYNN